MSNIKVPNFKSFTSEYGDIQVLSGAQAVRKRPTMYLGPNALKEPHTLSKLVIESLCLARAQAADGKTNEISINIRNGNDVVVSWNGPGISMEQSQFGKTNLELILSVLHACKNLKHESVQHFCENGIFVVNAVSEFFYVGNRVDDTLYLINYKKGELENGPYISPSKRNNGVTFAFRFDSAIFGDLKIDASELTAEIEKIKASTPARINLEFQN